MKIYIPTIGRINNQVTLNNLDKKTRQKAVLVIPEDEYIKHKEVGRKVIVCPYKGISKVRQFIIEYHNYRYTDDKLLMLDDDLDFFVRKDSSRWNLRPVVGREIAWIILRLEKLLNEFVHVGLSPRFMNNQQFPNVVKTISKQNNVHGVRPSVLLNHDVRYDKIELMEDYYVTLSLFKLGYPNCVIVDAVWDQRSGSNAPGGCSIYRNGTLQATVSKKLAALFPDFVKVVEKKSKTGWKDIEIRQDVRIQWKKAYEGSQV